ncbi:MAG: precorrin-8X methylmutase [Polyangiaceae bacterium]
MSRARIHDLYAHPMDASAIEAESFRRIDLEATDQSLNSEEWQVARRLVHTTADFGLVDDLVFAHGAIAAGCEALRARAPIYVDSNMIAAGLSLARLTGCNPDYVREDVLVHVADIEVAREAMASRLPRAVHAVRRARERLNGAIVCFGNSPVGLLELNRMIQEEGTRPALVVAMPVGFVHVIESKEELMQLDVPQIVIRGRRGGSPLAVATVHALAMLAAKEIS